MIPSQQATRPSVREEITAALVQTLTLLVEPGAVFEVRALKVPHQGTVSGYYTDVAKGARDVAAQLDGRAPGVYITPNPVLPDVAARALNRLKQRANEATQDSEIVRRRWLLIDTDPKRPSGISATEGEHTQALERAERIDQFLASRGWPEPVRADSGNGGHLLYRIDLPNDPASMALVTGVLSALATLFDDDQVKIDTGVANAARIWKLYPTRVCKGDNTPERPHRRSRLLRAPEQPDVVSSEALAALCEEVRGAMPPTPAAHGAQTPHGPHWIDDAGDYLRTHGIAVQGEPASGPVRKWVLRACVWNPDHTDHSAWMMQFTSSGAIAAGCAHTSCQGRGLAAFRDAVEPGWHATGAAGALPFSTPPPGRPPDGDDPAALPPSPPPPLPLHLTDLGNARRFTAQHGHAVRYVAAWGQFLVYDGTRWAKDETDGVQRLAKATVTALFAEVAGCPDKMERKALFLHAQRSENESRLRAMLALAKSELPIAVAAGDLDRHGWLLNVRNGTIDLRTGQLRPHDAADLLTKCAGAGYDSSAICDRWDRFLEQTFQGADAAATDALIDYVQRAVGYSLTAEMGEHILFVGYGGGANGKTTFVETLLGVLGDYGLTTPTETLMTKREGHIPSDVARLAGERFVAASEVGDGRRLDEELVKRVTGGDKVTARFMHHDWFEFTPECKVWLTVNHRPTIRGTDLGIWRRIHLLPFANTVPPEQQDRTLVATLLREEASGILAWAVRGCLKWQQQGLQPPPSVLAATADYRAEQDTIGHWVEECCTVAASAQARAKLLYASYSEWCAENGEHTLSQTRLGNALAAKGFTHKRGTGGATVWHGLRLNTGPVAMSK